MAHTHDDHELLDRYWRDRDESAFTELARRHLNLVYSAAVRRVGDRHLADDVTQAVFMILARKPLAARGASPLSAWLLTTVRYAASNALKLERRRRRHEQAAASATSALGAASPDPSDALAWQEIGSRLDDAVLKLPTADRRAVLLRYFDNKPIRDIAAELNVSEDAAKQRLSRSLDKLRHRLGRAGAGLAPSGVAGLAALLAAHAVRAAPASLVPSVCAAGSAAAGIASAATIAKGAIAMMTWSKIKAAAAIFAVAAMLGAGAVVTVNGQAEANRQGAPAPVTPADYLRQKAAARVKAAQDFLDGLAVREQSGLTLTLEFLDLKATAQRRLAEARIDAADNRAAKTQAAEHYVQQCRDTISLLERRRALDASPLHLAQAAYHLADAEYLLARIQSQ